MSKKKILHITSSFMPPKIQRDISFINDVCNPELYTGARVGGISNIIDQLATHLDKYEHHVLLRQHVDYVRGTPFNFKGSIAHEKKRKHNDPPFSISWRCRPSRGGGLYVSRLAKP